MWCRVAQWVVIAVIGLGLLGCQHGNREASGSVPEPASMTSQERVLGEGSESASGDRLKQALQEFQRQQVRPTKGYGFRMKAGNPLFELDWENPAAVEGTVGAIPLAVRWFDAEGCEVVDKAMAPGRYMAVLEGHMSDGTLVRRGLTFYTRPVDWRPELKDLPAVTIEYLSGSPIDPQVWEEHAPVFTQQLAYDFIQGLLNTEQGAILTTGLTELAPQGRPPLVTEHCDVLHQEHHLAVKRHLMDIDEKAYKPLAMPRHRQIPAPELRRGTPEEAGFDGGVADALHAVCQQWYEASDEPFVTLVARHGVVVFHEATGETDNGPVTVDRRFRVASITKAICGQMFAQFVDQGLIDIDEPVGDFFPEFPVTGDKAITMRHCFTHTTGLSGHGLWGGMSNPYLENVIANGIGYLTPGACHEYNGMGYDLAGKVMELVSGKSFVRLFHENYFRPLGLEETPLTDLGYSATLSAWDLGKIGQMMANRGSYGPLEFYSPETFERLLPEPLVEHYPALADTPEWQGLQWGIGLIWMPEWDPRGGKEDGIPVGATLLSPKTVGHGSASACILRVDLENDLVIAQVRRTAGDHYGEYVPQLMMAIKEHLRD